MAVETAVVFLAFGFGSGLAPFAPGAFGTLAALPLAFVLILLGIDGLLLAFVCIVLFMWGIRICACAERETGVSDHGGIVWDEIVAMLFVLAFVPFRWTWWLAAFVLFRLFDALKPPPSVGLTRICTAVWALWRTIWRLR